MKKWIAALIVWVLLSGCLTVWAADPNLGKRGMDVYGTLLSQKNYYEITLGIPGVDSVLLPDGTTLSGESDSEADRGLQVIIIPVTGEEEAEAYAWMAEAASDLGKDPAAYYLAFYQNGAFAQPQGRVSIRATAKDGYEKAKLFYMDGEAHAAEVPCTTDEKNSSFGMGKTGYYLFVKTDGAPVNPPHTGDRSRPALWGALIAFSIAGLALISLRRRETVQ